MSEKEAFEIIKKSLESVLNRSIEIHLDTDLLKENILDSLDSMIFIMEIEHETNKKFPESVDLSAEGYFFVQKLISYIVA